MTKQRLWGVCVLGAAVSTGCGSDSRARQDGLDGTDSGVASFGDTGQTGRDDAMGTTTADGSAGASTDGAMDDGPRFDVASMPDASEPQEETCEAVDFLFVIDNSSSMGDNQDNLVANFPAFIDGIEAALVNVDSLHVGVVSTDHNGYGPNVSGCNDLGGLIVRTGGNHSSDATCGPYAEGHNFMTEADDLSTTFSCAAKLGTSGSNSEVPIDALRRAIDGGLAGPGECNEGFLRDDALLVVVIITDEPDGPGDPENGGLFPDPISGGTPMQWYESVVALKFGIPENVVMMSLVHDPDGACAPTSNQDAYRNITDFTRMFGDNGFVGGICEDYGPLFEQAVGVIENACAGFIPPG